MLRVVGTLILALVAWPALAGPVVNGDFSTGDLTGWSTYMDPTVLLAPKVTNGDAPGGINAPSGLSSDYFAVLDSTYVPGNTGGQTYTVSILQNVTLGTQTGTLEFRLADYSDSMPPNIDTNTSGLLLDNVKVTNAGSAATLTFDWYALTHKDQARNDQFLVSFNGQNLFTFDYSSPLMPTTDQGGGGGNNYGPYTYGTGWQSSSVSVPAPPVPEPATWMLLAAGVVPLVRRRRR